MVSGELATADSIALCETIDDVKRVFTNGIAPYGYTASACGGFMLTERGPEPVFYFQDWPDAWVRLYREKNFAAVDFGVAEARLRTTPFTWREALARRRLVKAERDLWETANAWGWSDGLSVPLHGPCGYFGLVAMAGEGRPLLPSIRRELQMLAFAAHERCRSLTDVKMPIYGASTLSPREIEAMRWVAAGKTDPEIAVVMKISAATVRTHVDQARIKLGAANRPQTVARLLLSGAF